MVHSGRNRQTPGIKHVTGAQHDVSGGKILSLGTYMTAFFQRKRGADPVVRQFFCVFLDQHGVCTGRNRRAGEDAHDLTPADGTGKAAPCRRFADDGKLRADFGKILVMPGISVHRRIVEGRMRHAGGDIACQNTAHRLVQIHHFDAGQRWCFEQPVERI